ncbi:MAG TPA: hypothetical protein VEK57_12960 [Thermoanaerobaculia bacterium]|nr:hypothetical protein [Thermoanaerobaculia bacterium]
MSEPEPEPETNVKGQVDIFFIEDGMVLIEPHLGLLDRDVQTMVWTLHTEVEGVKFVNPTGGIEFPWPPDPDNPPDPPPPDLPVTPVFSKWPGDDPIGDERRYTADVKHRVDHGQPSQFYYYDIVLDTPGGVQRFRKAWRKDTREVIDPPIENEPKP